VLTAGIDCRHNFRNRCNADHRGFRLYKDLYMRTECHGCIRNHTDILAGIWHGDELRDRPDGPDSSMANRRRDVVCLRAASSSSPRGVCLVLPGYRDHPGTELLDQLRAELTDG